MTESEMTITGPASVLLVVPAGRNQWVKKQVTLHYEANNLIKVEGIEFPQAGPLGLTGTLFVVKESLQRDNRLVMRVERRKIVNGKVVQRQNWGEIEETLPRAA